MHLPAFGKAKERDKRAQGKHKNSFQAAKAHLLEITAYVILALLFYILAPLYSTICLRQLSFLYLALFYLACALALSYILHKNSQKSYSLQLKIQEEQEKINILADQSRRELKNRVALQEKIGRYNSLKTIIEQISQNLELESVADNLTAIAFSLVGKRRGTCILYLIDNLSQKPVLYKTRKEDRALIIKSKEGDIFDAWVLRHATPLLIEDVKKDFRFDLERLKTQEARPVLSLISSPLISEERFIGILRLDSAQTGLYVQDDLRLLLTVCDLGAVALENGELFQRTQDMAIHDGLTSLYTKGYFLERIKEEYKRDIRQGRPLSLLMLDIDYFKNYNDRFGHIAGDIVLKHLSRIITDFLQDYTPVVSRFGGEEFCVILSGIDKNMARTIAEGLCRAVEKTKVVLRRQETRLTVSIGVASCPMDARDEEELVFKADKAMYAAKAGGRNRVCCA